MGQQIRLTRDAHSFETRVSSVNPKLSVVAGLYKHMSPRAETRGSTELLVASGYRSLSSCLSLALYSFILNLPTEMHVWHKLNHVSHQACTERDAAAAQQRKRAFFKHGRRRWTQLDFYYSFAQEPAQQRQQELRQGTRLFSTPVHTQSQNVFQEGE